MVLSTFKHSKISGISVVVPQKEVCIYDEAQYYKGSIKAIDRMRKIAGFYKRRVVDHQQTALDFAYNASKNLIEEMAIDKNTIDALIYVVQKPDWIGPVNSYFLHHQLGLSKHCIATDVTQGCIGWVFGLYIASQMIETNMHKKILLVNGDIPSANIDPSNRNQAPIFGDAGCATLIERTNNEQLSYFNIETFSSGYDAIIAPFSACRFGMNLLKDTDFEEFSKLRKEKITLPTGNVQPLLSSYLNGLKVFDFTIKKAPEAIKSLLQYSQKNPCDIDLLALHQANKQIVQTVGQEAGFDLDKIPYNAFEIYGNNTMCSIPTLISMLNVHKENVCCCSFGSGLAVASVILNLLDTHISTIKTFEKPKYTWKNRTEYINYWRRKISDF